MEKEKSLICTLKPKKGKIEYNGGYNVYEEAGLEDQLSMFIEVEAASLTKRRVAYLKRLGVNVYLPKTERKIQTFTVHTSKGNIHRLSHRPWVEQIIPSQKMYLLAF